MPLSRRDFLKIIGGLGIGFAVSLIIPWSKIIPPLNRNTKESTVPSFSTPEAIQDWITNEFSGTKRVEATYFGAHYGGSALVKGSKIGTVNRNVIRTHDYTGGSSVWRARWSRIETSPGIYDWTLLDNLVNAEHALGHSIVHTLTSCPPFYSARPNEKCGTEYGVCSEPSDLKKWDDYCSALATRYAGKITHYEIWNEVNVKRFWTGSKKKMAEMVKRANLIIKKIDPDAKIIAPAVTGLYKENNLKFFVDLMNAPDNSTGVLKDWVDIINVHLYPPNLKNFGLIFAQIKNIREKMFDLKINDKPLWNTEYSCRDPAFKRMTPHLRKNVIQALLTIPSAHNSGGCDVSIMYGLDNANYGLVDAEDVQTWNDMRQDLLNGDITSINLIEDFGVSAVIDKKQYVWDLRV